MNPSAAESTSLLMLRLNADLDAHLGMLEKTCEGSEFVQYRSLFGAAMAALLDIANPIYRAHPQLKPVQLGGSYVVPSSLFEPREAVLAGETRRA